jgi:hypothetical protein
MKGRTVQPYRPGVNRRGDVQLPACDLLLPDSRVLFYGGRGAPIDAGAGAILVLTRWATSNYLTVRASLDPLPHLSITSKPRFLHISISYPDRYPGWDEQVQVVEAIAGANLDMAMIKPRRAAAGRRNVAECAVLQGLPADFLEDAPFTCDGKHRVIGNGVPLPMGRAIAKAVKEALEHL